MWLLKPRPGGIAHLFAVLNDPDGLREVWPGRGVPGAGKVTSIERQAGKWVVITSEGLIEFKRDASSAALNDTIRGSEEASMFLPRVKASELAYH